MAQMFFVKDICVFLKPPRQIIDLTPLRRKEIITLSTVGLAQHYS